MKRLLFVFICFILSAGLSAQSGIYTPSLNSPANNAVKQMPDAIVHWNAVTGSIALQYEVQLDINPDFNSAGLTDTTLHLITGYKTHNLIFNQTYYWRVRAKDGGETSYWSTVWNFTVFNSIELYQPADNAVNLSPDSTLQWKASINGAHISGITRYDYQIDTTTLFNSSLLIHGSTDTTSATVSGVSFKSVKPSDLRFGTKYYWRVRAVHSLATSDYCTPFSFTVVDQFTLSDPADGATKVVKNATLNWQAKSGLLAYQYQIALDANFTQVVEASETTDPTVTASFLRFGDTYYWKVRGRHAKDTSQWCAPWHFTVINTVVLETPANNAQNIALLPSFTWSSQTGISKFSLQVDLDGTFTNPFINTSPLSTDTKYTVPAGKKLSPLTTYHWRMRAYADGTLQADTTQWSDVWSFTTANPAGIEDNSLTATSIYPNPATDRLFIRMNVKDAATAHFTLLDLVGKEVISQEIPVSNGVNVKEINTGNLNKGIYIGRISIGDEVLNQKIIIGK